MSTNVYNVMSPILIDLNRYKLSDLKIEFKKSFIKSNNDVRQNQYYNYGIIPGTNNIYIPAEFNKNDSNSYIKLKDHDLWLHTDDKNNFFFDIIRQEDYYYRQPLVIWFLNNKNDEVVMYKYFGNGIAKINEIKNEGISNIMYINYKQNDNGVIMNWTNNINDGTKIIVEKIQWSEYNWTKPVDLTKKLY